MREAGSADLLRERRQELGLRGPLTLPTRALLLRGTVIGLGLLAVATGLWLGLLWRRQVLSAELERLAPVQGQSDRLQGQLAQERAAFSRLDKANKDLAEGLVAVRSGSALLEALARVTPQGVQLTSAQVQGETLALKGKASDPQAFRRINALVLKLQGLPLFDPAQVELRKASRESSDTRTLRPLVEFELGAGFRPRDSAADLRDLQSLGAQGMARRLLYLQREGLLR